MQINYIRRVLYGIIWLFIGIEEIGDDEDDMMWWKIEID